MTATLAPPPVRPLPPEPELLPVLQPGDSLTRDEFERRYRRMKNVKKAELIEGIVYLPSPVRLDRDNTPDAAGILKSRLFPGLWFDTVALLAGILKQALATLQRGVESVEHAAFAASLASP